MLDSAEKLEAQLDVAIVAHENEDYTAAAGIYQQILEADPNHPDANHNFAVLSVKLGLVDNALGFVEKAINTNPHVHEYWVTLIDALLQLERFEDAHKALGQAKSLGHDQKVFVELNDAVKSKAKSSAPKMLTESQLLETEKRISELSKKLEKLKIEAQK